MGKIEEISMRQVESIQLRNITLSNSRPTIPDTVNALAQSLERIGLIQPVTVQQHPDGYRVVAGNHRVAAARAVGWEEIEAFVLADDDTLENELREIDENLCRAELTPAQRAYSIKRRKEIWEVRSRETGGTTCPTSLSDGRRAGPQHEESFAAATAQSTGQSKKDINRHLSRAESLGEELLEVTGTSLDKGVELDALKKIPQEERRELIERAKAGEQVSAHNHRAQGTGENEWYTPQQYIDSARIVMGGIDLDPATSEVAQERICAESIFTIDDNGLEQEWRGRVWLNPPYAQPAIQQFMEKISAEFESGNVEQAIVLTHNYTDTKWFHIGAASASAICFTRGRIGFLSPSGVKAAPTQGQAFFYYGSRVEAFEEEFSQYGFIVRVARA